MKVHWFILAISIVTIVSCNHNIDINSGLVAYYPFNGNAQNANHVDQLVKVKGAILSIDRFGNDKQETT